MRRLQFEPLEDRTLLSAGALDLTFGMGGIVVTPLPGDPERGAGTGIALQSDGKIVAVGFTGDSANDFDFVVARYEPNGNLDAGFGTGGIVTTELGSGFDGRANDVAIDANGKIVVGGGAETVFVTRYNNDGTLDTSFSGDGVAAISGRTRGIQALAIQPDGKIVAAGRFFNLSAESDFLLVRFNNDGSLDDSFGSGGKVVTDFGADEAAFGLAIDSLGRIVAVGNIRISSSIQEMAIARYNPNGTLDTTFDSDGRVTVDFPGSNDVALDVVIDPDGKIVVAGNAGDPNGGSILLRLNDDGSLDTSFDGDGIAQTFGFGFRGLQLQPDGKIVAVGRFNSVHVTRWNSDGSPDTSFGTFGKVLTRFNTSQHSANDVVLQPDGKIVIVGLNPNPAGDGSPNNVLALARYEGDLQPINVSGVVFDDLDNDGLFEPGNGEVGIEGVTVTLTGTDAQGAVNPTTETLADGSYAFDVFAGSYTLTEDQPTGFLDGKDSGNSIALTVENGQSDVSGLDFAEIQPSDALGLVWQDFNNDGEVNFGEAAIENVTVNLDGTDDRGNAVSLSTPTDADGIYMFIDLRPGTYTLSEVQPAGFEDGLDTLGTLGGDNSVNDVFSGVVLIPDSAAENYNFGERPPAGSEVTSGQTATIGFWQNKNGQALIEALNGGPNATQLADWMSTTFVNMYGDDGVGAANPNDLTGKTNAEVADFYSDLFRRKKKEALQQGLGGPVKMDAQVFAVALATYVTNETLADTTAASFGFLVTTDGVGVSTFNVGDSGEAFDVADNTEMSVLDFLFATNDWSIDGILYDLDGDGDADNTMETLLRTLANDVYSAINEAGDL